MDNNKVLLYSTGNCAQYSMINNNGKEYEKECVYIYIYILNHFAIQHKLTQHCKSTKLQLKILIKTKAVTRDKEEHYIMIKGSFQEEAIIIVNICSQHRST